MLLKSSSTPVLGSLLSSLTDSPSSSILSESSHVLKHLPPTSAPQNHQKLSFYQTGSLCMSSFSGNSSPISPSVANLDRHKGFRRAQSEGNLEDLAYVSCNNNEGQPIGRDHPKRFSARPKCLTLQTIPSFSFYNYKGICEGDEEEESDTEDGEEREETEDEKGMLNVRIGERAIAGKCNGISLKNRVNGMILTEEVRVKDGICSVGIAEQEEVVGKEIYRLGIDGSADGIGGSRGGGAGGGGDYNSMGSGGGGGDRQGVEEYYKRMVEENPNNPLFLRNYAEFLYQYKQDCDGAEEYYSRAIIADPKDGEVLSQYGKLVWELHHDQDRASCYFERAVQASPEDSHVHAAYASFLWDTEKDEDNCNEPRCLPSHLQGAFASAGAQGLSDELVLQ